MGSYKRQIVLPAWGLFDVDEVLVATIRAKDAETARKKFKDGLEEHDVRRGHRVKKIES